MKIVETRLLGLVVLEPKVFADNRGYFLESYNQRTFASAVGVTDPFVQDNHSASHRNILRGLHYQIQRPQGKLVRVVVGSVFDVAVDLRRSSPTFGRWDGVELSADNKRMVWVPKGFAHGFIVLSESAEVIYKTTEFYAPEHERTLMWNDPDVGVRWPADSTPILSSKDSAGRVLKDAEVFP